MDVEKAAYRVLLGAVAATLVAMIAGSWNDMKRYWRISRM